MRSDPPYFLQANDTRACSCACAAAPGTSCAGTQLLIYDDAGCPLGGVDGMVAPNDTCEAIELSGDTSIGISTVWTGGTCAPQDTSTGMVEFVMPALLCCEAAVN